MKLVIAGERMEKVLDSVREYGQEKDEKIGQLELELSIAEMVVEQMAERVAMQDALIAQASRALGVAESLIEQQSSEIEEGVYTTELYARALEVVCDDYGIDIADLLAETILGIEEEEVEIEEEPACCAAGYCGTSRCGGNCAHDTKLAEGEVGESPCDNRIRVIRVGSVEELLDLIQ